MAELTFGEWLKQQRRATGLTQKQLAQQMDCAVVTVRKIEAEERRPSAQMTQRLAEIFTVPPTERAKFLRFARGDWAQAPQKPPRGLPCHPPIRRVPTCPRPSRR